MAKLDAQTSLELIKAKIKQDHVNYRDPDFLGDEDVDLIIDKAVGLLAKLGHLGEGFENGPT